MLKLPHQLDLLVEITFDISLMALVALLRAQFELAKMPIGSCNVVHVTNAKIVSDQ
jgi:hypothetical protein